MNPNSNGEIQAVYKTRTTRNSSQILHQVSNVSSYPLYKSVPSGTRPASQRAPSKAFPQYELFHVCNFKKDNKPQPKAWVSLWLSMPRVDQIGSGWTWALGA